MTSSHGLSSALTASNPHGKDPIEGLFLRALQIPPPSQELNLDSGVKLLSHFTFNRKLLVIKAGTCFLKQFTSYNSLKSVLLSVVSMCYYVV